MLLARPWRSHIARHLSKWYCPPQSKQTAGRAPSPSVTHAAHRLEFASSAVGRSPPARQRSARQSSLGRAQSAHFLKHNQSEPHARRGLLARAAHAHERAVALRLRREGDRPAGQRRIDLAEPRLHPLPQRLRLRAVRVTGQGPNCPTLKAKKHGGGTRSKCTVMLSLNQCLGHVCPTPTQSIYTQPSDTFLATRRIVRPPGLRMTPLSFDPYFSTRFRTQSSWYGLQSS